MAERYTLSGEFCAFVFAEAAILLIIPYIDWIIVNNVILVSTTTSSVTLAAETTRLAPVLASYHLAFEVIKWAVILPTVALVWLLKKDILAVFVWVVSIYVPLATGTEDLVYYAVGGRALPSAWPWLNAAPGISWTRYLTGTHDVVLLGVLAAALVGWILLGALWLVARRSGPLGSLGVRE